LRRSRNGDVIRPFSFGFLRHRDEEPRHEPALDARGGPSSRSAFASTSSRAGSPKRRRAGSAADRASARVRGYVLFATWSSATAYRRWRAPLARAAMPAQPAGALQRSRLHQDLKAQGTAWRRMPCTRCSPSPGQLPAQRRAAGTDSERQRNSNRASSIPDPGLIKAFDAAVAQLATRSRLLC